MSDEAPQDAPTTPALAALAATNLTYEVVRTRRASSVDEAASLRGIPASALLKTLVVRRGENDYVFVLVPGDRVLDWPRLRAHLGVRRVSLPDATEAQAVTGYERGAITPFGAIRSLPVVADASISAEGDVSLGGGDHGVSVRVDASALLEELGAAIADVARPV